MSQDDSSLRKQLRELLTGEHAHVGFDSTVADLPERLRGRKPEGADHTPWQILEHLRLALWDILEFSRDAQHVSPKWPEGYWPETAAPPDAAAWERSVESFRKDLEAMASLADSGDLYTPFPWGKGQTLLREILLVADHNAYHVGQLVLVRKLLGAWKS
jgi:DinB family protein